MDHFYAWLRTVQKWQRVKCDGTMNSSSVTLPTYIRHKTHHPENHSNANYTTEELKEAIDGLRRIVEEMNENEQKTKKYGR